MQLPIIIAILFAATLTVLLKKLTIEAAAVGCVLAIVIFYGSGWISLLLMAVFFVLSTFATGWKRKTKEQLNIAERDKGKRKASQVFANAGVAAIASIISLVYPNYLEISQMMIAASFSSAIADTLSSELGSVYGKNCYNILSFKKEQRGVDGAISIEGTLFGLIGSIIVAGIFLFYTESALAFLIVLIAGTIGNLSDSVLGATLERKGIIKNDVVNFLNTLIAAMLALIAFIIIISEAVKNI